MPNSAQLASISTALEDLTARITAIADATAGGPDEALTHELYEVERALKAAQRRLAKVTRSAPGTRR